MIDVVPGKRSFEKLRRPGLNLPRTRLYGQFDHCYQTRAKWEMDRILAILRGPAGLASAWLRNAETGLALSTSLVDLA